MKYLLLFSISCFSLKCIAQADTAETKHNHRLCINPTEIITGQYTIAYGYRFYKRNWIEAAIGYQYIPHSITEKLSGSPYGGGILGIIYADPRIGIGFKGPVAALSYAYSHKYNIRNYTRFEFSYQHLKHDPDCYYQGEGADEYTYSCKKDALGAEVLFSRAMGSIRHHFFPELYIGGGLHYTFGTLTRYFDVRYVNVPYYHFLCVEDIHDPNVSTDVEHIYSIFPMVQVGMRIIFRFGPELKEEAGPKYGKP